MSYYVPCRKCNHNFKKTSNASKQELVDLRRDLNVERDRINQAQGDISNINGTINMSREIIEMLGSQLNELSWDVKDLSR